MTLYVIPCGQSNTRVRVEQIIYAYDDSLISYVFWKTCTCNKTLLSRTFWILHATKRRRVL